MFLFSKRTNITVKENINKCPWNID